MRKVTLRLSQALKSRSMTQRGLAEMAGIRPSAISRLARANDVDRVSLEHLAKIAEVLGIDDIRELITIEQEDA